MGLEPLYRAAHYAGGVDVERVAASGTEGQSF